MKTVFPDEDLIMSPPSESCSSPSKKKKKKKNKSPNESFSSQASRSMIEEVDHMSEKITPRKRKLSENINMHSTENNIEDHGESSLEPAKKKKKKKKKKAFTNITEEYSFNSEIHIKDKLQEELQDEKEHMFQMPVTISEYKHKSPKKKNRENSLTQYNEDNISNCSSVTDYSISENINMHSTENNIEEHRESSLESAKKKKKKKKAHTNITENDSYYNEEHSFHSEIHIKDKLQDEKEHMVQMPVTISEYKHKSPKKKNKENSLTQYNEDNISNCSSVTDDSISPTTKKKRKKKNTSLISIQSDFDSNYSMVSTESISSPKKKKKKKKSLIEAEKDNMEFAGNVTTDERNEAEHIPDVRLCDTSPIQKMNMENNITSDNINEENEHHFQMPILMNEWISKSGKKKKKKDNFILHFEENSFSDSSIVNESLTSTPSKSKKKKKKRNDSLTSNDESESLNLSTETTSQTKKKKKNISKTETGVGEFETVYIKTDYDSDFSDFWQNDTLTVQKIINDKEIMVDIVEPTSPSEHEKKVEENTSEVDKPRESKHSKSKHKNRSNKEILDEEKYSSECSLSCDESIRTKLSKDKKKRSYSYFLEQKRDKKDSDSSLSLEISTSSSNEEIGLKSKGIDKEVMEESQDIALRLDDTDDELNTTKEKPEKSTSIVCKPDGKYWGMSWKVADAQEENKYTRMKDPDFLLEKISMRLENLRLYRDFPVHEEHTYETSISQKGYNHRIKETLESNDMIFKAKYTPEEDEIIQSNWKRFCEIHFFDEDEAYMFTQQRVKNRLFMPAANYLVFTQFLGQGLPKRPLQSIYQRFVRLHTKVTCNYGKFTNQEDQTILQTMSKSPSKNKFQEIAKVLNRTRQSVFNRYYYLKHGENVNALKAIIKDEKQLSDHLKMIMRSNNCETIDQLKQTDVSWVELKILYGSKTAGICRRLWISYLYSGIHLSSSVEIYKIEKKMIKVLYRSTSIQYQEQINWVEMSKKHFPAIHPSKLNIIYHSMKARFHIQNGVTYRNVLSCFNNEHCYMHRTNQVLRPLHVLQDGTIESFDIQEGELDHLDISDTDSTSMTS